MGYGDEWLPIRAVERSRSANGVLFGRGRIGSGYCNPSLVLLKVRRAAIVVASATNSVFALVLGLLAFIYLTSLVVVSCAEINSVRVDKLYPRSLLTPFTDNVNLTAGDVSQYEQQAQAQRPRATRTSTSRLTPAAADD